MAGIPCQNSRILTGFFFGECVSTMYIGIYYFVKISENPLRAFGKVLRFI